LQPLPVSEAEQALTQVHFHNAAIAQQQHQQQQAAHLAHLSAPMHMLPVNMVHVPHQMQQQQQQHETELQPRFTTDLAR
jgi:hypothetical protein